MERLMVCGYSTNFVYALTVGIDADIPEVKELIKT